MTTTHSNWSRCFTISGKPAGLRFECKDCRFTIPHDAPTEVFHCGRTEVLKKHWWERLKVHRIAGPNRGMTTLDDGTLVVMRHRA